MLIFGHKLIKPLLACLLAIFPTKNLQEDFTLNSPTLLEEKWNRVFSFLVHTYTEYYLHQLVHPIRTFPKRIRGSTSLLLPSFAGAALLQLSQISLKKTLKEKSKEKQKGKSWCYFRCLDEVRCRKKVSSTEATEMSPTRGHASAVQGDIVNYVDDRPTEASRLVRSDESFCVFLLPSSSSSYDHSSITQPTSPIRSQCLALCADCRATLLFLTAQNFVSSSASWAHWSAVSCIRWVISCASRLWQNCVCELFPTGCMWLRHK